MEKKFRLFLLLALLMTAVTGAWATDYTTLAVGDVIKVGDTFSPTADGSFNDFGVDIGKTYTLMRADIDNDYNVTEKTDGAYYVFKYVSIMNPNAYIHFEKAFAVTAISDGLEVTKIENIKGTQSYTLAVHEPTAAGYTVSLKDGVKDAGKWTVKAGTDGSFQSLPLEGVKAGTKVKLKYDGDRSMLKGVTAVKKVATKPDLLSSVFSVSSTKKVKFSTGNLRYASSKWSFFDNQYDYYTGYSADACDKFGWSTSATTYGMNTSTTNDDYSGDFVDWGATMGTGWFTLSGDEWTYLFNTRSASTVGGTSNGRYAKAKVNDVPGIILFPDTYTHPDGVTAPTGVNAIDDTGWNGNSYSSADWTKMESAGCVFLPAAGYRSGSAVLGAGSVGRYWSATPYQTGYAYGVYSYSSSLTPADFGSRYNGLSVRLVQAVAPGAVENAYMKWDNTKKELVATEMPESFTTVTSSTTTWEAGTYVVEGDVTIGGMIDLKGDVNLIIKDGAKLTVNSYINGDFKNLSIYGQAKKTGQLVVNCSNNHAISGLSTLEVHSAEVTATASGNNSHGGISSIDKFNVYGGLVDAKTTAADGGYGISLSGGGSMDIYGGEVKAEGKGNGNYYGILCGSSVNKATLTVYGGKLWAGNADNKALNYIDLQKGDGFTGKIETSDNNTAWTEYTTTGMPDTKYVRVGY